MIVTERMSVYTDEGQLLAATWECWYDQTATSALGRADDTCVSLPRLT